MENEHASRYAKFARGRSPISGRKVYGTVVSCRCGWKNKTNEGKREAERLFTAHVKLQRNTRI